MSNILESGKYSGDTTKNARWVVQWNVTKTSADGISRFDFVLYKTQDATSSHNLYNGCVFKFSLGSGCTMLDTDSYPSRIYRSFSNNVPNYSSQADFQEKMEFTLTGLNYHSGIYTYNSGLKGSSFAPTQSTTNGITYKGTQHLYGTVYIRHNESNGQATVNLELEAWIFGGYGSYPNSNSTDGKKTTAADLGLNYFYTAVTGPTEFAMSISDTSPVSKSLNNFTISWKGAQHGSNNQIAKYSVEVFKISNEVQTSFITQEIACKEDQGASNWLSCPIDLSSHKNSFSEGDWLSWRVKSIGTNTNYNSGFVNSTTGLYVNKTPSAPVVNAITSIIPIQGGTATYSANLSNTQVNRPVTNRFNNKTMTYPAFKLYRVSGSNKTEITLNSSSQFSLSVDRGESNFSASFCSYDGIDYSSSMSVDINRNPWPYLTFNTNPDVECVAGDSNYYYLKYKLSGAISNSYQNMKYQFGLRYSTDKNFYNSTEVILQELSTKNYYDETDIRDRFVNFATQASGMYFKFFAQGFDGYDYTAIEESNAYFIPGKPSFKQIYNRENCSTVSGTNNSLLNYFSGSLSLSFTRDTGYDGAILVINTMKGQYELPVALSHSQTETIVNATNIPVIKDLLEGGLTYTFNVKFTKTYSTQNTYYQTNLTGGNSLIRVKTLILGVSNDRYRNDDAYKMFTDENSNVSFIFTIVNQSGSPLDTDENNGNEITGTSLYGISSIKTACYLKIGDYEFDLEDFSPKYSSEYGEINYTLLGFKDYYNNIKNSLNKNGMNCLPVFFSIQDDFGSRYIAQSETGLYIDCVENLTDFSKTFYITNSSNKKVPLPSGGALLEGMKLSLETSFTSYNTNPKCQLQISRGKAGYVDYGPSFEIAAKDGVEAAPGSPALYTITKEISIIPQIIQKDYDVKFKLLITNDTGNIYAQEFTEVYTAKEFQAGTVSITGASYTKADKKLTLSYQIQNPGANLFGKEIAGLKIETIPSFAYFNSEFTGETGFDEYCSKESVNYNRVPYSTVIQKQITVTDEKGKAIESSSFYGILKVTTVITYKINNVEFENACSYQTLQTTIFNEAPTVSYRQNIIGINTNNVNDWSTGVLVISAITDAKKKVLFINPTCTPEKKGDELTGYIAAIDVYTGEIDGFIIDGGTWDKNLTSS